MLLSVSNDDLCKHYDAFSLLLVSEDQAEWLAGLEAIWRLGERYMTPEVEAQYMDLLDSELVEFDVDTEFEHEGLPALQLAVERALAATWVFRFDEPPPERLRGLGLN